MTKREIRRNPFTGEWIIYSESRQTRPDREEKICPLCLGSEEVPSFHKPFRLPNKYPSLYSEGDSRIKKNGDFFEKTDSYGFCELVVYTDEHNGRFYKLPIESIMDIFQAWNQATKEYSTKENINYVLPFENYGIDVGASLIHPHGQIYAFSIVPEKINKEIERIIDYQKKNNECMSCTYIRTEIEQKERIIFEDDNLIVLIPYYARYAYDIYIYPKRHMNFLFQATQRELESFAQILRALIITLNTYFNKEISYSLSLIQAPLKKADKASFHMYFKLHTPQRNEKSLKILGAVESTLDFFINGTFPETAVENIRKNLI